MIAAPEIFRFRKVESRSITAGNPTGAKAGRLPEWRHSIDLQPHEKKRIAEVDGPGTVRGIWMTIGNRSPESLRSLILRIYWDGAESPSVEAPFGDFFGAAHGRMGHYSTPCLGISEGKGFWCFFPMPFKKRFILEFDNDQDERVRLFYQINFTLGDKVTPDMGRFHAHFNRSVPPVGKNHIIMTARKTPGVYVGTLISALPCTKGSWREGEFQFYIDGDKTVPSIVGTGWSDWFLSAWGLGVHQSMYGGSNYQVKHPELDDRYYCGCYRFHLMDPIYFQNDMKVEHTQIGFGGTGDFDERSDDWCSVAYWYQNLTKESLPSIPSRAERIRGIGQQPWEVDALNAVREKKLSTDGVESGLIF
ncbi:MAG: glycoside hydrolase family 172 protein [Spirochaetota bacterium]